MSKAMRRIDISHMPELLRLAEEIRSAGKPAILRRESEDMAVLIPLRKAHRRREKDVLSKADREAVLSAAGSWKDVDTDRLLADIYADRDLEGRPTIEL